MCVFDISVRDNCLRRERSNLPSINDALGKKDGYNNPRNLIMKQFNRKFSFKKIIKKLTCL